MCLIVFICENKKKFGIKKSLKIDFVIEKMIFDLLTPGPGGGGGGGQNMS